MNRRTSLSALVGLSVLLTSLTATASSSPGEASQHSQKLVPLKVVHRMALVPKEFGSQVFAFVAKQKAEMAQLGAKLSAEHKVLYIFKCQAKTWTETEWLEVEPTFFLDHSDGGAFRGKDLMTFEKSGRYMDDQEIILAAIRADLTEVEVRIHLLVPENRVAEAQALYALKQGLLTNGR